VADQCYGKPSDGQRLREWNVLYEHKVPVLGHRQHPRHESQSAETCRRYVTNVLI